MVTLQGGDVQTLDDPDALPTAGQMQPVEAGVSGYVQQVDAQSIGRACVLLGAGRERAGDAVDPAVGCSEIVKTGAYVEKGAPLLLLHANDRERLEAARSALDGAFRIGDRPPDTTPLIGDITVPTFERH